MTVQLLDVTASMAAYVNFFPESPYYSFQRPDRSSYILNNMNLL